MLRTAERNLSEFVGQHRWFDTAHLVRGSPRLHRLASAHARYFGGDPVTTPLRLKRRRLDLNCSTEATGSVFLEIRIRDRRSGSGVRLGAGSGPLRRRSRRGLPTETRKRGLGLGMEARAASLRAEGSCPVLGPVWGAAPAARDCHASCSQHIAATLAFGTREAGTSAVAALA